MKFNRLFLVLIVGGSLSLVTNGSLYSMQQTKQSMVEKSGLPRSSGSCRKIVHVPSDMERLQYSLAPYLYWGGAAGSLGGMGYGIKNYLFNAKGPVTKKCVVGGVVAVVFSWVNRKSIAWGRYYDFGQRKSLES